MYDVFISYRRGKGSDLASYFDSELKKNGFNCYLDINTKYTGDFVDAIKKEIKKSNLFVLIITEGSIERFVSPSDITRIELETALENNIPVLPISVIGDELFDIINNNKDLPPCVKKLKDLNTRFYKHEMRTDTIDYVIQTANKIQEDKFKSIAEKAFNKPIDVEDKDLILYVSHAENLKLSFEGKVFSYTGRLKFGVPYGEGTLVDHALGLIYTFDWNPYLKFSGKGKIERNGKLVYEGHIVELKYDGHGYLVTNDYTFSGEFREGKINGKGVINYNNGTTIKGKFLGETCHSIGSIIKSDGSSFYGKLSDSKPNGYGILSQPDGVRLDGYFRNGDISEGAIHFETYIYIGDIQDYMPHGRGSMYSVGFEKMFEGSFREGKSNGNGTFYLIGSFLANNMIPKDIYLKLKEFHPNIDKKKLTLKGYFSNNSLQDFNEFFINDANTHELLVEGFLRNSLSDNYKYKIFKEYEEVFNHS